MPEPTTTRPAYLVPIRDSDNLTRVYFHRNTGELYSKYFNPVGIEGLPENSIAVPSNSYPDTYRYMKQGNEKTLYYVKRVINPDTGAQEYEYYKKTYEKLPGGHKIVKTSEGPENSVGLKRILENGAKTDEYVNKSGDRFLREKGFFADTFHSDGKPSLTKIKGGKVVTAVIAGFASLMLLSGL